MSIKSKTNKQKQKIHSLISGYLASLIRCLWNLKPIMPGIS